MLRNNLQTKVLDVRRIAKLAIEEKQIDASAIEAASESLFEVRREALEHGLTEADVVKAILTPLFAKKPRGCDCFTCKERRGELHIVR